MISHLNHVAFLVESIEAFIEHKAFPEELIGSIEEFPSEGTRELYIGSNKQMGRLLLMQAIGEGPYKTALEKRGAGIHHIAINVENIDSFVDSLIGSGWLLHPISLKFYNDDRQVYLCRPGVSVIIEVMERKEQPVDNYFIGRVEFPFSSEKLIKSLRCDRIAEGKDLKLFNFMQEEIRV